MIKGLKSEKSKLFCAPTGTWTLDLPHRASTFNTEPSACPSFAKPSNKTCVTRTINFLCIIKHFRMLSFEVKITCQNSTSIVNPEIQWVDHLENGLSSCIFQHFQSPLWKTSAMNREKDSSIHDTFMIGLVSLETYLWSVDPLQSR